MARVVTIPPEGQTRPDGLYPGGWWHDDPDDGGRLVCDLCPRACHLKPGDRGFCFVRQNVGGEMVLTTFGRSTGFCVDPVEKKPLNHFYPGTSVLSFGTAGCNLGCKFCQNWDISKSREIERLSESATPDDIAAAAISLGCRSVAFTYNDPVIWAEYAIETAKACRAAGVKAIAVTAGYITPEARGAFYQFMDAANVDLKGFTEEFYQRVTYSHLQPVLDTLAWLKAETDVWFEITNLVIPQANDSIDDIRRMSGWILEHCGDEVPLHFSAFHPDFRMRDRPNTPHETLILAHEAARAEGLKYVYVGNVHDAERQSTDCPGCGRRVVERDWYALGEYRLKGDRCGHCGAPIAGRFDDRPGSWGRRRMPVEIGRYAGERRNDDAAVEVVTLAPPTPTPAPEPPKPPGPWSLSAGQKACVLSAAAGLVADALAGRPPALDDPGLDGAADFPVAGAYVTLKRRGHLRACCGLIGPDRPLAQSLKHAARRTALDDPRMPTISTTELPYLDLSVNLLFGFERVTARGRDRARAVVVGRHGLRFQRGGEGGLLLPVVAADNGWDAEAFLRQVCRKAGVPTTAWEDDESTLFTFESVEFGGPFDPRALERGVEPRAAPVPFRFTPEALGEAAADARGHVLAFLQGRPPVFDLDALPDVNVPGVALTVRASARDEPRHLVQLSLRAGVPFGATLFELCESAAAEVARTRGGPIPRSLRAGVTVLTDPAMHGTAADPDLRGLDPSRRALLLLDRDRHALAYSPAAATADDLLAAALRGVDLTSPARAGLYSLEAQTTESGVVTRSFPKAVAEAEAVRPPALAGKFYPDDPGELAGLVDSLLASTERRPESWPAAMVPHAGLRYSGRVAASVFNRLVLPDLVIVIGPKHTRYGVDWAAAPHESWSIPGATLPADPALARALADAIPGLKLDSAAHRFEHAVEVELPFLARLNPRARVVGLAIGGGDWEHCRAFAEGLARVVGTLPTRPLLLISSDMNHFASDRETRRLDGIALSALERLDPAHLLSTVAGHEISMCGVLPAVIVMETLRRLGVLSRCERVAYATSGDVSGDTGRVVGYAGVVLG